MATEETVKLKLDTSEFDRGISRATSALGALATGAVAASIVRVTARFEDLRSALTSVTKSADIGSRAFKALQDLSTRTQFGVEELTQTYVKLASAGIQPTERLMRLFTDTAAVSTDQLGTLNAMADLFSRTTAGGLGLEDLNRLADRGIPVFQILQEKLGLSRLEISKFGQSAEGARQILDALSSGIEEQFGGATASSLGNLSTLMSNFSIGVTNVAAAVGNGASPALKELIATVTGLINASEPLAEQFGSVLGSALNGVTYLIKLAAENTSILGAAFAAALPYIGASGLAGAVTMAQKAVLALNIAIRANPIGFLISAVVALLAYLSFENGLGRTLAQISAVVDFVGQAFSRFASFIKEKVAAVIKGIQERFEAFKQKLLDVYNTIAEFIPGMDRVESAFNSAKESVSDMVDNGLEYAKESAQSLTDALANAVPNDVKEGALGLADAWTQAGDAYDKLQQKTSSGVGEPIGLDSLPQFTAGGVAPAGMSEGTKKYQDELKKRFESLQESLRTEKEKEAINFQERMSTLEEYYNTQNLAFSEYAAMREELEQQHQDKLASIQAANVQRNVGYFKDGEFAKIEFSKMSGDEQVAFAKESGKALLSEMAKTNKAAFRAQQALQISEAIMNTATGATKALAQGGIFGPILAGIVVAAGAAQIATIASQQPPGRFTGGSVMGKKPYIVGERGPEMFVPSQSGTIIPNGNLGNGKDVNVTFSINNIDSTSFDELLASRRAMIVNMVRQAVNENPGMLR